jgi:hypothetical protein
MQPGIKNDLLYLLGILESIGKIKRSEHSSDLFLLAHYLLAY